MKQNYEITGEQIVVSSDIPILSLWDIEITHRVNEHSTLVLDAALSEEHGEDILRTDWTDSRISVLKQDDREPYLFYGMIERVEVTRKNRTWQARITGAGQSAVLDKVPKKRSFQDTEMTYLDIVKEVTIGYNVDRHDTRPNGHKHTVTAQQSWYTGIAYMWNVDDSRTLGQPVIQYEETDWAFLKRLCSHFHGALVSGNGQEAFAFGMGQGTRRDLSHAGILAQGFDSSYFRNGCCEDGLPRDAAFYLEVRTRENWQTGDWVIWNDRRYQVYEKTVTYRNGELLICCRLGAEGTFYQKKQYNERLTGVRLDGTIRKTQEEDVCIQLDIDEKECAGYPWPWTPETNNISYCMPEPGMKAVLYLGTPEEKDGRVVLAGRRIRDDRSRDRYEKCLQTKNYKMTGIYPGHIICGTDHLQKMLSMSDRMGIEIFGDTDMSLEAEGRIQVEGKSISVMSPIAVTGRTGTSNIEVCRDFNFYAPEGVHTIGTGAYQEKCDTDDRQDREHKQAEKPAQEMSHWQASYSAIAAVPAADFAKLDDIVLLTDFYSCGSIPRTAKATTTIALAEAMGGKKDSECSFAGAFRAMDHNTVKGGISLPENKH
ncbi:MAG: hypothetical protein K1W41_05525 [Lachnospiraceae bacterium]